MQQESIDQVKDRLHLASAQNPEKLVSPQQVKSEFVQQYLQYFNLGVGHLSSPSQQLLQGIKSHDITFDSDQTFFSAPVIKVVNNSLNYELLTIEIKIGYFTFRDITITVINTQFPHSLTVKEGSGQFGQIFKLMFRNQELAMKVFYFIKNISEKNVELDIMAKVKEVINEYCMAKLASAIGVGPIVNRQMGFEILIYKDCIAYPMECCQNRKYVRTIMSEGEKLKEKLLRMHEMRFIHMDIKDINICFSKLKGEFVFIDFGFSKIIPENLGCKSLTKFFGTPHYCSKEMNDIITSKQGYVDLYNNDKCCLEKVLSQVRLDHEKKETDSDERFMKAIIVYYLKYLAYMLRIDQFVNLLQLYQRQMLKFDLGHLLDFIKSMSFSNRLLVVYRQILTNYDYLLLEAQSSPFSYLTQEDNQNYCIIIFNIVSNLHKVKPEKTTKLMRSVQDRQVLLDYRESTRLSWKVYVKLLLEVIQINVSCSTYQEKLEYCKMARKMFVQNANAELKALTMLVSKQIEHREEQMDDLEIVSLILFCYSLQGHIDHIKATIFHSIIYNVVLLKVLDIEGLLSFYQRLQHLQFDFPRKMRMLLKFKTTLHWILFQIGMSMFERAKLIKKIDQISAHYEEEACSMLTETEHQFLKIINNGEIVKQCRKNEIIAEEIEVKMKSDRFDIFLKDEDFKKELRMWLTCNKIHAISERSLGKEFESIVFQQFKKKQVSFEYYHFEYLLYQIDYGIEVRQCCWIIDLFEHIFQGSKVQRRYSMKMIKEVIYLHKNRFSKCNDFLRAIQQLGIEEINPDSYFGRVFSIAMHKIIQDKTILELPNDVRQLFSEANRHYLHRFQFQLQEQITDKYLMSVLETIVKLEYYTFCLHKQENIEAILRPKFKKIYFAYSSIIRNFTSKTYMNYALISLSAIAVYILFRKLKLDKALGLMKNTYKLIQILSNKDDIYTEFKIDIHHFFFKLAVTVPWKRHYSNGEHLIAYQKYYRTMNDKLCFRRILREQIMFIELFEYILRFHPNFLPDYINKLSNYVLIGNFQHQTLIYFRIFERIFLCGHFYNILEVRNKQLILANLQDVKINPYNAIYLHFSMRIPSLWTRHYILQISKSFNLIDKPICSLILQAYYKYALAFFHQEMKQRQRKYLFFLSCKHEYTQSPKHRRQFPQTLAILLDQKMRNCNNIRSLRKLQVMKSKVFSYFFEINKRAEKEKRFNSILQYPYPSPKFNRWFMTRQSRDLKI